jgi:hypothetical protein
MSVEAWQNAWWEPQRVLVKSILCFFRMCLLSLALFVAWKEIYYDSSLWLVSTCFALFSRHFSLTSHFLLARHVRCGGNKEIGNGAHDRKTVFYDCVLDMLLESRFPFVFFKSIFFFSVAHKGKNHGGLFPCAKYLLKWCLAQGRMEVVKNDGLRAVPDSFSISIKSAVSVFCLAQVLTILLFMMDTRHHDAHAWSHYLPRDCCTR